MKHSTAAQLPKSTPLSNGKGSAAVADRFALIKVPQPMYSGPLSGFHCVALSDRIPTTPSAGGTRCNILYVTPEISDFVKAGGLGDVSATLPRALKSRCDVRVLIPGYRQVLQSCGSLPVVGRL